MRRLGIILLVIGLAGFLAASSQRAGYDSAEGKFKAAVSSEERGKKDFWGNARWALISRSSASALRCRAAVKKSA
jgi:hypothetical protein